MKPEQIAEELSDIDLEKSVLEIKQWHKTGILPGGVVRSVSERVENESKVPDYLSLRVAEDIILFRAAERFIELLADLDKA